MIIFIFTETWRCLQALQAFLPFVRNGHSVEISHVLDCQLLADGKQSNFKSIHVWGSKALYTNCLSWQFTKVSRVEHDSVKIWKYFTIISGLHVSCVVWSNAICLCDFLKDCAVNTFTAFSEVHTRRIHKHGLMIIQ